MKHKRDIFLMVALGIGLLLLAHALHPDPGPTLGFGCGMVSAVYVLTHRRRES